MAHWLRSQDRAGACPHLAAPRAGSLDLWEEQCIGPKRPCPPLFASEESYGIADPKIPLQSGSFLAYRLGSLQRLEARHSVQTNLCSHSRDCGLALGSIGS